MWYDFGKTSVIVQLNILIMNDLTATHHHSGHTHTELIKELIDCALACEACAKESLDDQDITLMARCIELDRDCADICFQAVRLLQRDSELAHQYLVICEEACRLCAEECSKHDHDHCRRCAKACQKCEAACHQHHGIIELR